MKNLFSVGELSKLQNISRQTLIFYDKIGLFCPAYITVPPSWILWIPSAS